jgi:hypothetical protein
MMKQLTASLGRDNRLNMPSLLESKPECLIVWPTTTQSASNPRKASNVRIFNGIILTMELRLPRAASLAWNEWLALLIQHSTKNVENWMVYLDIAFSAIGAVAT